MWRFLEGVLSPSAGKKVKQKLVPYVHQDMTFFRGRFAAFVRKKRSRSVQVAHNSQTSASIGALLIAHVVQKSFTSLKASQKSKLYGTRPCSTVP